MKATVPTTIPPPWLRPIGSQRDSTSEEEEVNNKGVEEYIYTDLSDENKPFEIKLEKHEQYDDMSDESTTTSKSIVCDCSNKDGMMTNGNMNHGKGNSLNLNNENGINIRTTKAPQLSYNEMHNNEEPIYLDYGY